MPQAIHTVEKIDKLAERIPENLIDLTERADKGGTYFWAHLKMVYRQEFDTDVEKGASVSANASAPALAAAGGIDAGASGKVGAQFQKSRDGLIDNTQQMAFMSKVALAEHGPILVRRVGDMEIVGPVLATSDENPTDDAVDDQLG